MSESYNDHNTLAKHFTVEKIPYIYEYNYFSCATQYINHGYYVDHNGVVYKYNIEETELPNFTNLNENDDISISVNTIFEGLETIEPGVLFSRLHNSVRQEKPTNNPLDAVILKDLTANKVMDRSQEFYDIGLESHSIWVLEPSINIYKRIVILTRGYKEQINLSSYSNLIIDTLGSMLISDQSIFKK